MKNAISLFNVTKGLVTELCEANAVTVGDMGSRSVRQWLCSTRPVSHIGQQAVLAFATVNADGEELRHGIFESIDGESLELTSSGGAANGWFPFMTMQIGGSETMIRMAMRPLRRMQEKVTTVEAKAALGLLLDAIDRRLPPIAAAA